MEIPGDGLRAKNLSESILPHVIVASVGTHGDVFPFIALGRALRARGFRVTLAINESYRLLAEECGCEFVPLATDEETEELLSDPGIWNPYRSALIGARWGVSTLRKQYDLLSSLASGEEAILAAPPQILAARLVQEKLSRRLATIYYMPWMIASSTAPPEIMGGMSLPGWVPRPGGSLYWWLVDAAGWALIGRHLNRLRASLDLPPVRRLFRWWTSPELAVGLFPDWYGPPQPDWPPQLRLCGFPLFDGLQQPTLAPKLVESLDQGDPPIAITFGTGMKFADRLFSECVTACKRINHRALVLTRHADQLPSVLPDGVRHVSYAPLTQLLPHCAAVIHHGGIGTTAKGLATGCPQLIIPHAWDQLDNARRVERLGAGSTLSRKSVSPVALAARVNSLLTPAVRQRCAGVASRFGAGDPLEQAAAWIAELNPAR